jgi:hypothetical protein
MELEACMEIDDFTSCCKDQLPPGLELLSAREIPLKSRALMAQVNLASYIVRVPRIGNEISSKICSILNMDHVWIERASKGKKKAKRRTKRKLVTNSFVDIKPFIRNIKLLEYADETLDIEMLLGDGQTGKARPEEVARLILGIVEDADQESMLSAIQIRKTGCFIERQGRLFSPMEILNQ